MIGVQSLQLPRFENQLISRDKRKLKMKKVLVAGLMLTSMVDMFSLLVIFLLQSFSNSPEIVSPIKDMQLPSAMTAISSQDAPVVAVSNKEVYLDQKTYGAPTDLMKQPDVFLTELQHIRDGWVKSHPKEKFRGEILLQADQTMPSILVSQVINLLMSQGYGTIQLAVITGKSQ